MIIRELYFRSNHITAYRNELGDPFLTNQSKGTPFRVLSMAQLGVWHFQSKVSSPLLSGDFHQI